MTRVLYISFLPSGEMAVERNPENYLGSKTAVGIAYLSGDKWEIEFDKLCQCLSAENLKTLSVILETANVMVA